MYVRVPARLMEGCEDVRMGESKVARRFEHRWRASLSHGAPICGDAHQTSTEVVGAVLGKVGGMCEPWYGHVEPIDQQRLESDGCGQDGRHVTHLMREAIMGHQRSSEVIRMAATSLTIVSS